MTTPLAEVVEYVDRSLGDAGLPHAFGGALALAYHVEEPRATRDIDVNVFVPTERAGDVLGALDRCTWDDAAAHLLANDGQARIFFEETPVDLFLVNHPFHEQAAANVERVPFLDATITILSATDLAVFKVFFNRTRDWADLEAMVDAGSVDLHVVIGWAVDLLGAGDERVARLHALIER
jgi:hypothetical protein